MIASPWSATLLRVRLRWAAWERVKSHWSRSGVCLQCDLMPKAPSKTRDFDWNGTLQTNYLGVH